MAGRFEVVSEAAVIVLAELPEADTFLVREACAEAWDIYRLTHQQWDDFVGWWAPEPDAEDIAYFVLSREGVGVTDLFVVKKTDTVLSMV